MSLLAALTIKVSAILLVALTGAACLRTRAASARHWVLAVGVLAAGAVPALHVLPILPAVQMAPADAGVLGTAVAAEAVAAVARVDAVSRLAVTIWLAGAVASVAVLLVGLARLRWLRASSSRVADGPWHRLCTDLARSVRPAARCRPPVRSASGAGGHVGLAATGRPAAGVGSGVVGGADARSAAARACARAPRRLAAADRVPRRCAASGGSTRWRGPSERGCVARVSTRRTTWCWRRAFRPPRARRTSSSSQEKFGDTGGRGCRRRQWPVRHNCKGGCPPC